MKALLSVLPGGPELLELRDVTAPVAGPGQAVVEVKACGVNFPDVLMIEDRYQDRIPRPFAPGGEVAGVVVGVGKDVTRVRPGDRVLGDLGWGGMSEQVAIDANRLLRLPAEMPYDEAAAFLITYGTAYFALKERAGLHSGESLLVLGAAGGVGLAAIQLGKAMSARVVAAASSPEKLELCRQNGADDTLIYPRTRLDSEGRKALATAFKGKASPDGFDVVFDAVGGDYAESALRAIAWEGRFLVIGFASGEIPRVALNLPLLKGCAILGAWWGPWVDRDRERHRRRCDELFALYERGLIRPFVSERYPLAQGAQAIQRLSSRQAMGKVVVTMGDLN